MPFRWHRQVLTVSWRATVRTTLIVLGVVGGVFANGPAMPADFDIPLGLIAPVFPTGDPPTTAEIALGHDLFNDPALSRDGSISCASCHDEKHAFSDPRPMSIGVDGRIGRRHSPTIINAVFFEKFGWIGKESTLEGQTLSAITSQDEMALPMEDVLSKVDLRYKARFLQIFGAMSLPTLLRSMASYQRSLISGSSSFDNYLYGGDENAITDSAKRGFDIFLHNGRCIQCHLIRCERCHPFGGVTAFFSDNRFHNLGIGFGADGRTNDVGRAEITGRSEDYGSFRTPSLRNVALTGPYMHDGSLRTLSDVVEHYNKGGIKNPNLDPELRKLNLNEQDKIDLVSFLESLTSYVARR